MDRRGGSQTERISSVVLDSLDDGQATARGMARRAYTSRSCFFHLCRALFEETPAALRRRLLLERAAWQLSRTARGVTDIAFEANYGSLEAFTRAFRRAYRISPSLYRRMGATHFRLPASNRIHFAAPGPPSKGDCNHMDLFELFNGAETWHTRRLLECAQSLTDQQLDQPLHNPEKVFPWDTPDQTLREVLERMVQTKEVWTAALLGGTMPPLDSVPADQRTPAALLARLDTTDADFSKLLADVQRRGAWSDTFVDALCDPPETFTFGGMFAHIVTFNAYRRLLALSALRRLGVKVEGFGCPSEFEAALATVRD